MDWPAIEHTAISILRVLQQFQQGINVSTLMQIANDTEFEEGSNEDRLRNFYRGIDLLERAHLIRRINNTDLKLEPSGSRRLEEVAGGLPLVDHLSPEIARWAEVEDLHDAVNEKVPLGANRFARLTISNWRQFEDVDINFHPRLTVLTGANAAGKTTLMNVLAPHFSWSAQLISSAGSDISQYKAQARNTLRDDSLVTTAGQLVYANGARTPITHQAANGITVSALMLPEQQGVPGIFISSHRSISNYRKLEHLPARFSASTLLLEQFIGEIQARYSGGSTQFPPLYRMKEALVGAAMYGYGNKAVMASGEAREVWEGFQDVLANFLPASLKFKELAVSDGDILIRTTSGAFPMEASSGGLSAMLELSWQIFLRGRDSESFTVCIDEPENHLHPELQRTIMPALLRGFPHASFIVATHSPYVVTATPDSSVYALRSDESGRVRSRLIDAINASATADETLMSVLGLDTPLPFWAEEALGSALRQMPPNPKAADLRRLQLRLRELGLSRQFPAAVAALDEEWSND